MFCDKSKHELEKLKPKVVFSFNCQLDCTDMCAKLLSNMIKLYLSIYLICIKNIILQIKYKVVGILKK